MSELQIESVLEGLRDVQIQFVRDVLENLGFKDNKVVIEPASKSGDNYVASVARITVVVENGDNFKMIGKFAPDNEALRQAMNTSILFNNETIMYQEVLPKLVSLQVAADVPEKDLLRYAKCYGCFAEQPNEVIILEDLKELNYVMLDRFSSLSDDAVRLILKNFAILHSLSYVLKEKEPDTYNRLSSQLIDIWNNFSKPDEFKLHMTKLEEDVLALVDDKYKNALRGVVSQMPVFSRNLKKTEATSKYLVIQQGDSWTNNIMFKMTDNVPSECIMIDYQLSREANPLADFFYMVFNCTDHSTRSNHYLDWVDFYHDELDKALSDFRMKANFVYPRDQLDADLKRYSKLYFGMSVMLYSVLCRNPKEAAEVKEAMQEQDMEKAESMAGVETLSSETAKLFKTRVEDLVESYRLFGYL